MAITLRSRHAATSTCIASVQHLEQHTLESSDPSSKVTNICGFSIWHWIIVLFFFCSIAAVISLIVWVAKRASRKSTVATTGSAAPKSAQARLLELDPLGSQQLITDADYQQRRSHILSEI